MKRQLLAAAALAAAFAIAGCESRKRGEERGMEGISVQEEETSQPSGDMGSADEADRQPMAGQEGTQEQVQQLNERIDKLNQQLDESSRTGGEQASTQVDQLKSRVEETQKKLQSAQTSEDPQQLQQVEQELQQLEREAEQLSSGATQGQEQPLPEGLQQGPGERYPGNE